MVPAGVLRPGQARVRNTRLTRVSETRRVFRIRNSANSAKQCETVRIRRVSGRTVRTRPKQAVFRIAPRAP